MQTITFKRRLIDFFNRHDESKLPVVDEIVHEFKGHEEKAFSILNKLYLGKKSGVSRELSSTEMSNTDAVLGTNAGAKLSSINEF